VDRLDTWLTAQRGSRLLLVRWVALAPFGLGAGSLWSFRVTFDPATPQVRALVARLALCMAASLALAALTMLPPVWRHAVRRPDHPWPTWRLIAQTYIFSAAFVLWAYENAEPLAWRWRSHNKDWVFALQLALIGVSIAMSAWSAVYLRRLQRPRDHGAKP
jgi:hypothetical protein